MLLFKYILILMAFAFPIIGIVAQDDQDKDSHQISIVGDDIYVLPANSKPIYHGTKKAFDKFKPFIDKKGVERGTWFGEDMETSTVQAYKGWCLSAKEEPSQPAVLEVKTLKNLFLLLVPKQKTGETGGHSDVATKIGATSRSLFGVSSDSGAVVELLKTICSTKVFVKGNTIVAWSRDGVTCKKNTGGSTDKACEPIEKDDIDAFGPPVKLDGWRAPWDQNEIAVCHEIATDRNFEPIKKYLLPVAKNDRSVDCRVTSLYRTEPLPLQSARGIYDYVFGDKKAWDIIRLQLRLEPSPGAVNATVAKVVDNEKLLVTLTTDNELAQGTCIFLDDEKRPVYLQVKEKSTTMQPVQLVTQVRDQEVQKTWEGKKLLCTEHTVPVKPPEPLVGMRTFTFSAGKIAKGILNIAGLPETFEKQFSQNATLVDLRTAVIKHYGAVAEKCYDDEIFLQYNVKSIFQQDVKQLPDGAQIMFEQGDCFSK